MAIKIENGVSNLVYLIKTDNAEKFISEIKNASAYDLLTVAIRKVKWLRGNNNSGFEIIPTGHTASDYSTVSSFLDLIRWRPKIYGTMNANREYTLTGNGRQIFVAYVTALLNLKPP